MRSSKTARKTSSVAAAVWHVAPSKCYQYSPLQFLWIFQRKINQLCLESKFAPNSDSFWMRRLFNVCVRVFCAPKCDNFACLHTRQDQNELHLNIRFFFAKIGIFCKSIAGPLPSVVQAYTQPYSFGGRIKLIICQIRHELSVIIHEISTSWKKNVRWRTL